jgi:hypothetical protein
MADDLMEAWIETEDAPWLDSGAAWAMEDPYHAAVRGALAPHYRHLPAGQLDRVVEETMESLTPLEAENFGRFLSNLGRSVAPIAAQVLPVAAPILGTVIGGPAGAAIGGTVGRLAGQAIGGAVAPRPASPVAPRPPAIARPAVPASGGASQPSAANPTTPAMIAPPAPGANGATGAAGAAGATGQLLSLLQHPALLQSIVGQVLGPAGARAVPVGPAAIPVGFGAFMNALSVLANQAASEAEAYGTLDESEATAYLRDASGQLTYDPAVAEERAAALLALLGSGEADGGTLGDWGAESGGEGAAHDRLDAWFQRSGLLQ